MTESEICNITKSQLIKFAYSEYQNMGFDIYDERVFYQEYFGRVRCCLGGLLVRHLVKSGELVVPDEHVDLRTLNVLLRERILFLDQVRLGRLRTAYHFLDNKSYAAVFGSNESFNVKTVSDVLTIAEYLESVR